MEFTEIYPMGGHDKMREPVHFAVAGANLPGITIYGRTWTRSGAAVTIFHNGESMSQHRYSYGQSLSYEHQMAIDAAEDINLIMQMNGLKLKTAYTKLLPIMRALRDKCESRYGAPIEDSNYEVLVQF